MVIGGDGTLRTALKLVEEGVKVIGVPKTIDNDIAATDFTFGFDTAVQIVTDAIDRLTTTAEAHNRVILVEVMGRTKGWIATYAGIAGGAEAILIPEVPYDLEEVAAIIRRRHRRGKNYSIVVVAEGVEPPEKIELREGRLRLRPPRRRRLPVGARHRGRSPGSRPGSRCSATSSGVAPRPPSTGCWPPGSAPRPPTSPPRAPRV